MCLSLQGISNRVWLSYFLIQVTLTEDQLTCWHVAFKHSAMAAVLKVNWGFHTQISQIHKDTVCTWRSRRPRYSNRDIRVWSWAFLWLCQSSKMHPVSKQTVVLQNTMCLVCGTFYIRILRWIVLFFAFFCVCVGGHRGFWEQRCTWMRNDEWCLFLHRNLVH